MRRISQQSCVLAAAVFGLVSCSSAPQEQDPADLWVQPAPMGETRAGTPDGAAPVTGETAEPKVASEVPTVVAPGDGRSDVPAQPGSTAPVAPAAPAVGRAVIHSRVAPKPVPRVSAWPKLQPVYDQAQRADARFEFAAAETLYRELRDSPWTPDSMRDRFHQAAFRCADIRYEMGQVRNALDRHDFQLASERAARLAVAHPEVPWRALFDR